MRPWPAVVAVAALLLALPAPQALARSGEASAAGPARLVADSVRVDRNRVLVAEGAVEVFYGDIRLRARRLAYDPDRDTLIIEGPITLVQDGRSVLLADGAQVSADLRAGIMTGARLVLDRQLQIAAGDVTRSGGRLTRLRNAVASSCQVCAENPTPLWEIRADEVIHDQQTRQLHFRNARLRVMGQAVAYAPRLRLPDPTVTRMAGFLPPSVVSAPGLGTGVRLPYFLPLGPRRDLLLTPDLRSAGSASLHLRYRQALAAGPVEITGAIARDRLQPGRLRGFAEAEGRLRMAPGVELSFGLVTVSDRTFLDTYGISDRSLLANSLALTRTRRDALSHARAARFESLVAGANNARLPGHVVDAAHEQRLPVPHVGGVARIRAQALGVHRRETSALPGTGGPVGDLTPGLGRDMARLSVALDWQRDMTLAGGVLASVTGVLRADRFETRQDAGLPPGISRIAPAAAVELRWPWLRHDAGGGGQVLEPVAQLVWSPMRGPATPNEDSRLTEFDEGNLFSLNRFAGGDGLERGHRGALGLRWTHLDPAGWSLSLAGGRVFRTAGGAGQFSAASGLSGLRSDWLGAGQLRLDTGLSLMGRSLIGSDGSLGKTELRLGLHRDRLDIGTNFATLPAETAENRPRASTEIGIDAAVPLGDFWTASADWRYDLANRQPGRLALGASYLNECLSVDVSLSRRYASSTNVAVGTDVGLQVTLVGFGAGRAGPASRCMR